VEAQIYACLVFLAEIHLGPQNQLVDSDALRGISSADVLLTKDTQRAVNSYSTFLEQSVELLAEH
jgi:hypothetical protein